jgi:hypothetical protein
MEQASAVWLLELFQGLAFWTLVLGEALLPRLPAHLDIFPRVPEMACHTRPPIFQEFFLDQQSPLAILLRFSFSSSLLAEVVLDHVSLPFGHASSDEMRLD